MKESAVQGGRPVDVEVDLGPRSEGALWVQQLLWSYPVCPVMEDLRIPFGQLIRIYGPVVFLFLIFLLGSCKMFILMLVQVNPYLYIAHLK